MLQLSASGPVAAFVTAALTADKARLIPFPDYAVPVVRLAPPSSGGAFFFLTPS